MLRVALDGRRLQDRPLGGVGRILSSLEPYLSLGAELVVLTDRRRPGPTGASARVVDLPGFGPLPETAWLQLSASGWIGRHHPDVFHGSFNAVPVRCPSRSVVSIYDLAWEDHPEDLSSSRRAAFRFHGRWAARHADVILTVSQFTARAIIERYGVSRDRLIVSPVPPGSHFGPGQAERAAPVLQRLGIRSPYLLAVGGAPRRALPVAVAAWRLARTALGSDIQLVVVGPPTSPEDGVVAAGFLPDAEWAALLAAAAALCYPTRYEGFGLPALEAIASGTPVVCRAVASLPEVLGDAAEWVESTDPEHFAAALVRLLTDETHRRELAGAGLRRVAEGPTWEQVAQATLSAYQRAAS